MSNKNKNKVMTEVKETIETFTINISTLDKQGNEIGQSELITIEDRNKQTFDGLTSKLDKLLKVATNYKIYGITVKVKENDVLNFEQTKFILLSEIVKKCIATNGNEINKDIVLSSLKNVFINTFLFSFGKNLDTFTYSNFLHFIKLMCDKYRIGKKIETKGNEIINATQYANLQRAKVLLDKIETIHTQTFLSLGLNVNKVCLNKYNKHQALLQTSSK